MITPTEFKSLIDFDNGEKEVYDFLYKLYTGDKNTHVYHNLVINFPGVDHRELDFLVIGPFGVILLEVKAGNFRVNGNYLEKFSVNENKWVKVKNEDKAYSDPIDQVLTGAIHLENFFKYNNHSKAPIESKKIYKFIIIINDKVKKLESPIQNVNLLTKYNYQNVLKEIFDKIDVKFTNSKIDLLSGIIDKNCNYHNSFERSSKTHGNRLIALSKDQFKIINELNDERILLEGVAGAGKTLIAIEAAKIANKKKWKTLFICHSSNLNSYLREILKNETNITISTMQGFLTKLENIANKEKIFSKSINKSISTKGKYDFIKTQKPSKILSVIDKIKDLEKYDYLIIDEAQDILTVDEMKVLSKVVKGEFKSGKWLICYDKDQALMGDVEGGLKYLQSFMPKYKNLKTNIRTPKEIFFTALKLAGLEKTKSALDDYTTIETIPYKNIEDGRRILIEFIYKAFKRKFKLEDITLLSPENKKNTEILGTITKLTDDNNNFPIKVMNEGEIKKNHITFSEILRFKGLENKCIVLTGINDFMNEDYYNLIYVALTRSTHMALILYPISSEKTLLERLGKTKSKKK
jgi:hypothetical protein